MNPDDWRECLRGYVPLSACDEMGHMNIQHFVARSDEALAGLTLDLGTDEQATVRLRQMRFHSELKASDLVSVRAARLEGAPETVLLEIRECLEDRLAATAVLTLAIPAPEALRLLPASAQIPETSRPRSILADEKFAVPPADIDALTVTHRTVVTPDECGTDSTLTGRHLMRRLSDTQGHMWALAGLGRHEQMAAGLATATLELRLEHLAPVRAGDGIEVRTRVFPAHAKVLGYKHYFFARRSRSLAAVAEGRGVLFDRETRKAVLLPPEVRERLAGAEPPMEEASR